MPTDSEIAEEIREMLARLAGLALSMEYSELYRAERAQLWELAEHWREIEAARRYRENNPRM